MLLAPDGKVELRVLSVGRSVGNNWLVDGGLRNGDRVIVQGMQLVRPGQDVSAVEVTIDEILVSCKAVRRWLSRALTVLILARSSMSLVAAPRRAGS
jgi:membrane fusion protein (multidrug efflux system)